MKEQNAQPVSEPSKYYRPAGPKLLRQFALKNGLTAEDIACRLVPRPERQTVVRWWVGDRRPDDVYRPQLEKMSGGKVPITAWRTLKEVRALHAREEWLRSNPEPARASAPIAQAENDVEADEEELDGEPEEGDDQDDEDEEPQPDAPDEDADEDIKPSKPKSPKPKKEKKDAPPLPAHDRCGSKDPIQRLKDRYRERFEAVDCTGAVLRVSKDFCELKAAMDAGEISGATSVRCMDCGADLAKAPTGHGHGFKRRRGRPAALTAEDLENEEIL